ncbi:MAG: hypothetical protein LBR62_02435 [Puniceicoccales bacterium]|jgi:hypothetical protein|nr:hypothetical protein [Puniceicoccales bacterium]
MSGMCRQIQEALEQFLVHQDFLKSFRIVSHGVGGLEGLHQHKLATYGGRILCLFHPLPHSIVDHLGTFYPETLSLKLGLGCDGYDDEHLLDTVEALAILLHGHTLEYPSGTRLLYLPPQTPWSEPQITAHRQWVQMHLLVQ